MEDEVVGQEGVGWKEDFANAILREEEEEEEDLSNAFVE